MRRFTELCTMRRSVEVEGGAVVVPDASRCCAAPRSASSPHTTSKPPRVNDARRSAAAAAAATVAVAVPWDPSAPGWGVAAASPVNNTTDRSVLCPS